jgi:ABC-type uncharacterized transport system involved in gliding motility auxiliary subunit
MKQIVTRNRLYGVVGLALLLGILALLNLLARGVVFRKDLTEEKLYTLSPGTRQLLGSLDRPVTLKLFYSRSMERVPMPMKYYAQRVQDLLREFVAASKGRLILEVYDPRPDTTEEEWARKYGLAPQGFGGMGDEAFYFGLVAQHGAREAALPFIAPALEPQIEYLITRMIYEVRRTKPPKIGLYTSLPMMRERSRLDPNPKPSWLIVQEMQRLGEVRLLSPQLDSIPNDLDVLVVVHPQPLRDHEAYQLDQYVMRGGRLIAFVDPLCLAARESETSGAFPFLPPASDLNRLTGAWGAELVKDSVLADFELATRVTRGAGIMERMPMWLTLRGEQMDQKEVALQPLKMLMLPFAGAFRLTATNDVEAKVLIKSTPDAGFVSSFMAMSEGVNNALRDFRKEGELPVAVRLRGRLRSAFPNGRPAEEGGAPSNAAPHVAQCETTNTVILVADADVLYERYGVREIGFFGQSFYQPFNDNFALVMNMLEQMLGGEALVGLRSRSTYDRPFTRVLALEARAQERWREEEQRLQAELEATQARLNELQAAKSEDQQFIITPEQQREIEQFRKQVFETEKKLREVRRKLREDIEKLGFAVKVINMGAMPALVAAAGLLRGWRRRCRGWRSNKSGGAR